MYLRYFVFNIFTNFQTRKITEIIKTLNRVIWSKVFFNCRLMVFILKTSESIEGRR